MNTVSESMPEPVVARRRWHLSLIWLVPAVAALVGISMLVHAWLAVGPEISISFHTAAGLEAGKTPVKYKDVTVGMVSGIRLSEDGSKVVVTVSLDAAAENLARVDTRFWVVRPRIGTRGVSGVDTLLSGAYIGVDRGSSQEVSRSFIGLETPPSVYGGAPGRSFALRAEDLGSLDIGSPVYFRRVQVGHVVSYQLDEGGENVRLQIFIDAPHDRLVSSNTRFWNASGVDVSLGADGFRLRTQSIATLVSGGIAFATPEHDPGGPVPENTPFTLAADQTAAMAPPDGPAQYLRMYFDLPLRGLSLGAPVLFSGIDVGKVVSTNLDYDPATRRFRTTVGITVYPHRLEGVLKYFKRSDIDPRTQIAHFLAEMVEHGLRGQVRSANLLTGQLYVSIEHVPNAPKVAFDESAHPLTMPTASGSLDRLEEEIAGIVAKINQIPFASIGKNLDAALAHLDVTLRNVDSSLRRVDETLAQLKDARLVPEAVEVLRQAQQAFGSAQRTLDTVDGALADDSPLRGDLGRALREVERAARSLRALTDLLGRHPESLLRGRPEDPPSDMERER
ncbi:MAG: MlaD family protein [Candidatus Accumulibacter sp.]|nr:MlaD family protein [Accumulibacter sp.]